MKKRKESVWSLQICVSILLLMSSGFLPLAAANVQVTIVQSNDNSFYDQTRQGLKHQLTADFQLSVISADTITTQEKRLRTSDIIITLGIDAALKISGKFTTRKIISAYITLRQQQQYQVELEDHTVVLLNQPLSRYFAFTSLMLQPESIGIINQKKLILDKRQKKTLSQFNLNLRQYELQAEANPISTVRSLLRHNDAHLMLPEENIYNRDTLKGILLTSYRSRKPVISYSPSHVKAGALASIFSSPSDIGSHLASIVGRLINKPNQVKPAVEFAQYFSVAVNKRVAHALSIKLPDEAQLISELKAMQ